MFFVFYLFLLKKKKKRSANGRHRKPPSSAIPPKPSVPHRGSLDRLCPVDEWLAPGPGGGAGSELLGEALAAELEDQEDGLVLTGVVHVVLKRPSGKMFDCKPEKVRQI